MRPESIEPGKFVVQKKRCARGIPLLHQPKPSTFSSSSHLSFFSHLPRFILRPSKLTSHIPTFPKTITQNVPYFTTNQISTMKLTPILIILTSPFAVALPSGIRDKYDRYNRDGYYGEHRCYDNHSSRYKYGECVRKMRRQIIPVPLPALEDGGGLRDGDI